MKLISILAVAALATAGAMPAGAATPAAGEVKPGSILHSSPDGLWEIRSLGKNVYTFRWNPDFYQSLFVVAADEVLVVDPIGEAAARAYRDAIGKITDAPITKVVYSHSHRDHIVGAAELAPSAEIISHPKTKSRLAERGDPDVPAPTRTVDDGDVLAVGEHRIGVHYFGPTHSDSLIALTVDTGLGRLLMFVDAIEPGIPAYRNMADFHVDRYIAALEKASQLNADVVMGGHTGPAPGEWVSRYLNYMRDLLAATQKAWQDADKSPRAGEDGIRATERIIAEVTRAAAASIREKYSDWRGFDVWAPMNAERMLVHIQTGD